MSTRAAVEPDLVIDLRDPPAPPPDKTPSRRGTDVVLLLVFNALNVLDALLTHLVTRAGLAVEANPIVRAVTLPGKVAVVAALSLVLWKVRPRALVVPIAGYTVVVCYTITGALWLG